MLLRLLLLTAMLTDVPQTLSAGVVSFAFGVLLNCGALAWWVRSGTDMKIAQKDATEAKKKSEDALTKSNVLESRVNQQDTIINEIRTRMAKLDRVDELVASAKFIEEAVTRNMVPRSEHQQRWESSDQRFARIEEDMRDIKDQLKGS